MKKFFLVGMSLLAVSLGAVAQDMTMSTTTTTSTTGAYKQSGGENNLEFQFAPLGGTPISIGGIRYRKFTSPLSAFRLTTFLGYTRTSKVTQDAGTNGNTDKELKDKTSQFNFSIRPGIEKHFTGTERLSPYIGGELDLGFQTTGKVSEYEDAGSVKESKIKNENGHIRFGVNGVAGFDYYFARHIYVGAELGFGLSVTSPMKTKTTPAGGTEVESKEGKEMSFNLGPNVNSFIRMGFLF